MAENNKIIIELLLKKWELLWNHYKFQDEMMEKRRNLLWIIQSFIFAAWYYCFLKSTESIFFSSILLFRKLSIGIPVFGIIINIILLIVLKRHGLSLLINENSLRDVEFQLNSLCDVVKLDRFSIDKHVLFSRKSHIWDYAGGTIEEHKFIRWTSQRWWLNKIIPNLFILIWLLVFVFVIRSHYFYY